MLEDMIKDLKILIMQIDLFLDYGNDITKKEFKDFKTNDADNFLSLSKNIKQNTFFYNMNYKDEYRQTIDEYELDSKFYELNNNISGMLITNELWTKSITEWTEKSFRAFSMSIYNIVYSIESFKSYCDELLDRLE